MVENHKARNLTINNRDECKRIVNRQKTNFLAIELVNLTEVKDLKINLTDEQIYQLINNANKAKCYYD